MAPKPQHFFVFQMPRLSEPPVECYNRYAGKLMTTSAVSPAKAANNIIYRTFCNLLGNTWREVIKHIHTVKPNVSDLALDLDALDNPVVQPGLFGGQESSHRRRDPDRLARLIADRYHLSTEGERTQAREVASEYVRSRR